MFKRISLVLICAFIILGQAAYPLGLHAPPLSLPDIPGRLINFNLEQEIPIMPISLSIEQSMASFQACRRSI